MSLVSSNQWAVETRTRASSMFFVIAAVAVLIAFAAPFFLSRSGIQDLFFILTMLVLAQCWNLLAGYAGLVSVGQQAFVGMAETIKLWQDTLERLAEAGQFPGGSLVTKYPFQVV